MSGMNGTEKHKHESQVDNTIKIIWWINFGFKKRANKKKINHNGSLNVSLLSPFPTNALVMNACSGYVSLESEC